MEIHRWPKAIFALEELDIFEKCTLTMWALIHKSNSNIAWDKEQKLEVEIYYHIEMFTNIRFNVYNYGVNTNEQSNLGSK